MPEVQEPKLVKLLGNRDFLNRKKPVQSLMKLAAEYGSIFRLKIVEDLVVISSWELTAEVCDDSRFDKKVFTALRELRTFAGDGLFTAYNDEENWGKAHRILLPAFGPASLRGMFDAMAEINEQMLSKWEQLGDDSRIEVAEDMTRLTLDTLALSLSRREKPRLQKRERRAHKAGMNSDTAISQFADNPPALSVGCILILNIPLHDINRRTAARTRKITWRPQSTSP